MGDRYLGTAAAGKGTRPGAVARGAVQETPTEAIQSGGEKLSENLALQRFADPSQKLMQDVGEEAVAGGLAGGLMGGAMGGALHRGSGPAAAETAPAGGPPADAAEVLGTPVETPAEKALFTTNALSALDRVGEIERLQSEAAQAWANASDTDRPGLRDRLDDLSAEHRRLTEGWPTLERGAQESFSTESGARLDSQYALAEADDLVTSHDENLRPVADYPAELQPRERERHASEMQVSGIVQRLDPARLGLSADAATGAPIIGADGLVESGNARTIALKRVYQANGQKADDYRNFLTENADRFGFAPEKIAAMRRPVLVRVRETPVDRAEFARQANAAPVAQMSPSELARTDAARIEALDDLDPTDDGDFTNSHAFIRRFMARLPATEQAALVDSGGRLSQAGYARIRNAILAKAYGDSPVLARMIESVDDNLRNVGKAMMQAAPEVAKLRQDVADGALHDADIVPDLMAAVTELSALKDSGRSVSDALAQAGMFGDQYSQETRELLQFLNDNLRRPRRMAEFIVHYSEALRAAGNPNQTSLFGETAAPTKGELLTAAKRETHADEDTQRSDAGKEQGAGGQGAIQPADAEGGKGGTPGHEGKGVGDHAVLPSDFVPASNGSLDFGEITPDMARAMRRQAGKIRLQQGVQNGDGTGWGLAHIEANHGKQIRNAGFESAEAFIAHVATKFNEILQAKGRQLLVAVDGGRQDVMFVQLEADIDGGFYRINTAFPASRDYLEKQQKKGMKLLWGGSEPASPVAGQQALYAGAPETGSGRGAPIAQGQSSNASIGPAGDQVKTEPTPEIEAGAPLFSRNLPGDGGGMSVRDLRAVRERVAEQMSNLPPVNVFESPAQAPAELRDYIEAAGAWTDVEGAYHEGEIYLFASGLASEERAEFVLATHEITHYGLRGAFGVAVDPILQQIWMHNAAVRKAATALRARNGLKSNVAAVEEVLADMPNDELVKLKGWRRLVQFVRDWLAKAGFQRLAKQVSDWMTAGMNEQAKADVFVADVLRTARAWVTHGKRQTGKHVGGTRLADNDGWRMSRGKDVSTEESMPANSAEIRADAIIADDVGAIRPIDAIAKALVKGARIDRLTSALYDKAAGLLDRYVPEQIKAGVVSDYGVPEAVIDRRTTMHGAMKRQVRDAGKLIDKLATLTRAESRVAYEWMNNADPQAAEHFEKQLPPESIKVMGEVKQLIDRLSQEAVKLGQLDPDTFARNRFEYLRRSYVKHTAELTRGEGEARQKAISILGDQYKGRGMTDVVPMAKFRSAAPEWWGRKLKAGQADKALRGEKFIRLERRRTPTGEGTLALEQAQGPGDTNPQKKGRLLEVAYWPVGEPVPAKYSTWEKAGTWEVRDTKGGNLIVWRDFTKQERIGMGEIDEARFAIAKTLHGMIHDVETGRYLEWLGRRYGKADAAKVPGTVVEATDRLRQTYGKDEWVQVPESKITGTSVKKYGALAGTYLPGPIWNDVRQTVGFRFAPFGETYAAILNAWKTSKTALSPAVHLNNVMANFVMADWHDVSAGHVLKALRLILSAHERDGKGAIGRAGNGVARLGREDREAAREVLTRFADSGGNIGSWATAELQQEQLAPLLDALDQEVATAASEVGVMAALQKLLQLRFPSAWEAFKPTKAGKALTTEARNMIALYESEDQVFRLAAWLRAKEDGVSDLEAGKAARRSFLDYNINAPWVQAMRKTAFPFIAFTYRALPMLLETAAKKPWKLMKLGVLAAGLNALGYLISGGDEDDERRYLPEEKSGRVLGVVPKLIRMPWNDPNGSPVFLDIRRFVPVGDFFDTGATHAAVPLLPFAVPSGPLAVLAELVANRSQFSGRDIALETDTASEQAGKVLDHIYKAFAPNLALLPGTYAFDGIAQASSGRTDAFGREQSTPQAVASAFGLKLGSYPGDVLRINAWRETQAKTMEIDKTINQLKRERMRNSITASEYQEKLAAQMEKKRAVVERFRQK